jgi:hypothetical protein
MSKHSADVNNARELRAQTAKILNKTWEVLLSVGQMNILRDYDRSFLTTIRA